MASTISSVSDLDVVIDADSHVAEGWDDLLPYIEKNNPEVYDLVEGTNFPLVSVYTTSLTTPVFQRSEFDQFLEDDAFGSGSYESHKATMDEYGIQGGVVSPTFNLGIPTINNDRIAVAVMRAYNDWVFDHYSGEYNESKATILVATQTPEKAAEEIERIATTRDPAAVCLSTGGSIPPLGHRQYYPIYEAAEKYDLPIVLHGSNAASPQQLPVMYYWNETYAEDHIIGHPFPLIWHFTSIMYRGIPERYPNLEFVLEEAGISWVPYIVWRLDDHFMQYSYELPDLEKPPSEYVEDQFYFTTQPLGLVKDNPKHLASIIEMVGPDRVMFSADFPHGDFDTPEELLRPIVGHFDDETIEGIMGETAVELFDIPQ
jgi:predicted TIM-barrel fold metal-dependent hydrolase